MNLINVIFYFQVHKIKKCFSVFWMDNRPCCQKRYKNMCYLIYKLREIEKYCGGEAHITFQMKVNTTLPHT